MPFPALVTLTTVFSYLIGGLPFGYWFVRWSTGVDIRTVGSGNIGATNVHRTAGGKAGLIVLLLDILKGFFAVWLTGLLTANNPLALALAASAVMLGHCYPALLGFKGGKAVACFVGAFLYLTPLALAFVVLIFLAVVFFSKYVSLGSLLGAAAFPILVWLTGPVAPPVLAAALFAALLVIYRHKANIARLTQGKEHTFSLRGRA